MLFGNTTASLFLFCFAQFSFFLYACMLFSVEVKTTKASSRQMTEWMVDDFYMQFRYDILLFVLMEINHDLFCSSHSLIVCGMQIDYSQQTLNKVASELLLVLSRHHKTS